MAKTFIVLTEADGEILLNMIEREKKTPRNKLIPEQERPSGSPEVYIAKLTENIPALELSGEVGTGTGTATFDIPGSAACDIYRVVPHPSGESYLELVTGFNKTVYNVAPVAIHAGYVVIKREKYGSWIAECPTGSILKAVANEDIAAEDFGDVTIWRGGEETDPPEVVEAHLNWIHGGEQVSAGTRILIMWFPDEAKWVIIYGDCEA